MTIQARARAPALDRRRFGGYQAPANQTHSNDTPRKDTTADERPEGDVTMTIAITDDTGRVTGWAAGVIDLASGSRPAGRNKPRRAWLLRRLAAADGPAYDALVAEIIAAFPAGTGYWTRVQSVKAVRDLLWNELAVTEADESIWLTPAGWAALEALTATAGAR